MKLKVKKMTKVDADSLNISEQLIVLNRVAKVVKGGRRFSFNAMMVVGDRSQHCIGVGFGKANEVPESIKKGIEKAKKNMIRVRLNKKNTLPHEVIGRFGSTKVWIKPATEGTGLIAGATVRMVLEHAGVHDVLTKVQGSRNALNVAKATYNALASLMDAAEIARRRGKEIQEIWD
jgi:small subunit ribosomal protein S5